MLGRVAGIIERNPRFASCLRFDLSTTKALERSYLKENHLISAEMEKGGENRVLFLTEDVRLAVMVNEEDHLRMYALHAGFLPFDVLNEVIGLESQLGREIAFAFSQKYGYLTACPTNTGTGLRASVMLHLPALSMIKQMAEIVKQLPSIGLTVRGFYGENSENTGDFFQVSNEVTLGKSEEEIVEILVRMVSQIVEKETEARQLLFEKNATVVEDDIWRAWGLLTNARVISSSEAVQLLSKLRLGVDRGFFGALGHGALNRLIVEVQPGHLQYSHGGSTIAVEERDLLRASVVRKRLAELAG